jgi:hypothetical protein
MNSTIKHSYTVAGVHFEVCLEAGESVVDLYRAPYLPFVEREECVPHFRLKVLRECPEDNTPLHASDGEEWEATGIFHEEDLSMRVRKHRESGTIEIAMQSVVDLSGWMLLTLYKDFREAEVLIKGGQEMRIFGINNALMMLYALRGATLDRLLMHASVIKKGAFGYLFLGKSGTGKSTHSQLWLKEIERCELLNDDNPVIGIGEDGAAFVSGSPWSGKTPCYRNEQAKIGAFVRLWQAPKNEIQKLTVVEAYAALLPTVSNMKWETEVANGINGTLEKLLRLTSVYSLRCLPDGEAALLSYRTVSQS